MSDHYHTSMHLASALYFETLALKMLVVVALAIVYELGAVCPEITLNNDSNYITTLDMLGQT